MSERSVRDRYVALHGDHPLGEADELVVRTSCLPVTDPGALHLMAAGRLPPPAYVLDDGTPMVRRGTLDVLEHAGGADRLHDWFTGHWDDDSRPAAERAWEEWLGGAWSDLVEAMPVAIRRYRRLEAQARRAVSSLEPSPRDHVARGSLEEALEGLERLLAPETEHDRLRSGGAGTRRQWVSDLRERWLSTEPPPLPIRTDRLLLRPRDERDLRDLHAMYGDPEVTRYLLMDRQSLPDLADFLRRRAAGDTTVLGLAVELEGRVVGEVALIFRGATQAELGWTVNPEVGGRGLATEAAQELLRLGFEHYALHRIYAELDARNARSARLCERLGMRLESHRLADFWSKGEWTDTLHYALLADEWSSAGAPEAPGN